MYPSPGFRYEEYGINGIGQKHVSKLENKQKKKNGTKKYIYIYIHTLHTTVYIIFICMYEWNSGGCFWLTLCWINSSVFRDKITHTPRGYTVYILCFFCRLFALLLCVYESPRLFLDFLISCARRAALFPDSGVGKDTRGGRGRNGKGGGCGGGVGGNKQGNGTNKSNNNNNNKKGGKSAAVKKGGGGATAQKRGRQQDAVKHATGTAAGGERVDDEAEAAAGAKKKMELELAKIQAQALLYAEKRQDRSLEEAIIPNT